MIKSNLIKRLERALGRMRLKYGTQNMHYQNLREKYLSIRSGQHYRILNCTEMICQATGYLIARWTRETQTFMATRDKE